MYDAALIFLFHVESMFASLRGEGFYTRGEELLAPLGLRRRVISWHCRISSSSRCVAVNASSDRNELFLASAAAGPGSASDLQAMVLVTLARCSISGTPTASTTGGYRLLTPFALSDTARGPLGGNALAIAGLFIG